MREKCPVDVVGRAAGARVTARENIQTGEVDEGGSKEVLGRVEPGSQLSPVERRPEEEMSKEDIDDCAVHNAQFVQYLYLTTEQAGTYLKSGPV